MRSPREARVTAVKENEIARLLKRGLNHYGLGELDAAIVCWESVRALDPGNQAARDYLETAYEERAEADQAGTPVSVSMLQLLCLPEPFTPANGFS